MVQLRNSINSGTILILDTACLLQTKCNFLHGFFRCKLPAEVVDMEVKVTSVEGTLTFKRYRTTQLIRCMPWTTKLCLHPNIFKRWKLSWKWKTRWDQWSQHQSASLGPHSQKPILILKKVTPQKNEESHTQEKVQASHPQGYCGVPSLTANCTKTYQWCIISTCDSKRRYSIAWHRQDVGYFVWGKKLGAS